MKLLEREVISICDQKFEVKEVVKEEFGVRRTLISHPIESRVKCSLSRQTRTHIAIVFLFSSSRREEEKRRDDSPMAPVERGLQIPRRRT